MVMLGLLLLLAWPVDAAPVAGDLSLTLSTNRVPWGDTVALTLNLGTALGEAQLESPAQDALMRHLQHQFRVPARRTGDLTGPQGHSYSWALHPTQVGIIDVPALTVLCRERTTGKETWLRTAPIPLEVRDPARASSPEVLVQTPAPMRILPDVEGDSPAQGMWRDKARSQMLTARTAEAWRQVALTHRRLQDGGPEHGAVFYNEGTAWLMAGDASRALIALERAELRLGGRPDIRRNQALARRVLATPEPWADLLVPWHRALSMKARMLALLIITAGTVILLAWRPTRRMPGWAWAVLGGCIVLLAMSELSSIRRDAILNALATERVPGATGATAFDPASGDLPLVVTYNAPPSISPAATPDVTPQPDTLEGVSIDLSTEQGDPYPFQPVDLTLALRIRGVRIDAGLRISGMPPKTMLARSPFRELPVAYEGTGSDLVQIRRFRSTVRARQGGELILSPHVEVGYGADGKQKSATLIAAPLTLSVRTLPEANRPDGFAGPVGQFSLQVDLEAPSRRNQGLLTLTSRLRGKGFVPEDLGVGLAHAAAARLYAPRLEASKRRDAWVWTQQIVRLGKPDAIQLPAVEVVIFDPIAETYVTLSSGAIPLAPDAGAVLTDPAIQPVYFAPSPHAMISCFMPSDAEYRVLKTHDGWNRVRSPLGMGWIPADRGR